MYDVSEEYKRAIASDHVKSRVSGTMTLKNGVVYEISDANIQSKSLRISRRCTNNGKFNLGTAYMSQMNMTVLMDIDRYSVYGAKIKLSLFQKLQDDSEEEIKLGEFFVNSPKRDRKSIAITAYDAMNKFDIMLQEDAIGTPYELLTYLCSVCNVTLGNTNPEIAGMPNGNRTMKISPENLDTCRDALAIISKMLAGYAIIDRNGCLTIKTFATVSMGNIPAGKREKSNIADYETYFVGAKGRFLINGVYQDLSAISAVYDSGILLDIGDVPIYQANARECEAALVEIVAYLDHVRYTPCKVTMISDAALDPGDALTLQNVNNSKDSVLTIFTATTWSHHASMELISEGYDTVTQSVSSYAVKMISTLEKEADNEEIRFYRFTNAQPIYIGNADTKKIIDIRFASNKPTIVIFNTEISMSIETTADSLGFFDAECKVQYRYNDVNIDDYEPKETWVDGNHLLHLLYTFEIQSVTMNHLEVFITMNGGSMAIPSAHIKSSVYGQGLVASDTWDGTIDIRQVVTQIILPTPDPIRMNSITDMVSVGVQVPVGANISDNIARIQMEEPSTIVVNGVTDTVGIEFIV